MTTNQLITKIGRQRVITALANVVCQGGGLSSVGFVDITGSPSDNAALQQALDDVEAAANAYTDQEIAGVGGAAESTLAEALAGTNTTTRMSPRRTRNVTERVYNVEAYGAMHDYQTVAVANITSGTDDLTVSSGTPFTAADVGKAIRVFGAGAAGADLLTTISAFVSSTAVTLSANASTTIVNKVIEWGTDDTPFIQLAINAAFAAGGGTVYFPNGVYFLAGALVTSVDGVNPNCQLYLPLAQFSTSVPTPAPQVRLVGESVMPIWGTILADTQFSVKGVILKSIIIGTGTEPAVIGSSFYNAGTNINAATLSVENIAIRVKSITGVTHVAPTMSGFNFSYSAGMDAFGCKYDTESGPFSSVAPASTVFGFKAPIISNSGNIYARHCATQNTGVGFLINEHFVGDDLWINASLRGIESGTTNHAWYIGRVQCNGCATGVYVSGAAHGTISQYTAERKTTGGYWFNFSKDVDGSSSNAATVNILSSYIVDNSLGINPPPQFGTNVLGTTSAVNMPGINTSKRFFGNGGFRAGNAGQASFPSFHEYNSGVAGQAFTFCYSTNQSTTTDGVVSSSQFANTNTASGEQRIAQFNALTGGAVNTGKLQWFIANAGTLVEVFNWFYSHIKFFTPLVIDADISPTALAVNTDNYAPTGIATAATLRISASSAVDLTGIAGGATMVDGRELTIINVGTTNTITLKTDVTSTAANRFLLNADFALAANMAAKLVYDGTSQRWRKTY